MCRYCKELNQEKETITVDTIKISSAGYYNYYMPIYHCPVCGRRLKKYIEYTAIQLTNGIDV